MGRRRAGRHHICQQSNAGFEVAVMGGIRVICVCGGDRDQGIVVVAGKQGAGRTKVIVWGVWT
jgi:hypothetical protein